jgi:tetratricopeptide (TPR) repeat protein
MANMGLRRLGDEKRAREVCDLAISFAPKEAGLRTVRGITTYPSDQAMEDFREAVRLGDPDYYPYYFLAHAALVSNEFADALLWSQRALERRPGRRIEAQLYLWTAMARKNLGGSADEVNALRQRAIELDPDNPQLQQSFDSVEELMLVTPLEVDIWSQTSDPSYADNLVVQQTAIVGRRKRLDLRQRELVGAGA